MAFNLSVAGIALPTDAVAYQSFQDDLNLAFDLDAKLSQFLDTPLANVPASAATSSVAYTSPAAQWAPGNGVIQFGLQGGVTGTLAIVTSGTLLSYTDGLDCPQTVSVPVPPNTAYLSLTFKFNISANVAGSYSGGEWGVKAAASTTDGYAITFSKAFAPNTTVREALPQVFKGFVLPLHPQTLAQLQPNDFLLHEFSGNQQLSFGAYFGLDQVLYAGQSKVDVLKTLGSPLASVAVQSSPEIKAGVNLDFEYQYNSLFECLISKSGNAAGLHLYRSSNSASATVLTAGLTFNANTTVDITPQLDAAQNSIVNAAGGAASEAGKAVGQVLSAASPEISKYISEVNDKLASWLSRANGVQANLEAAIESAGARTMLAAYTFNLAADANAVDAAWKAAIGGNFVAALATGAVCLAAGSGLEQEYQRKTSFTCNLFNLWSVNTWSQFSSNVSLVYAGNNVFHMHATVGRTLETKSMGAMRGLDIYFTASADTVASGKIANPQIDLHIDLAAQSDPKAIGTIATILNAIEAGPACDDLARAMHAFAAKAKQSKGTALVQVTIPASAYAHLNCDEYINSKPVTNSTYNDAANWTAFAQAADDLNAWALHSMSTVSNQWLAFLKTFAAWQKLNIAQTGGSSSNRMQTGDTAVWPEGFPQVDTGSQTLISYSMHAGQTAMNFIAALCDLAKATDVNSVGITWDQLINDVTEAIQKDVNTDFVRPMALAVIRLCKSPAMTITGPSPASVPGSIFAVTIQL